MLKKLMLSAALGALMATGAFAQANPPASQPAPRAAPAAPAAPMTDPKFIASQSADQWVFSKFKGTDVLGSDNAHIGDVVDVLFDKSGKVAGLIIGVGGFLGIGEKNVAIDMSGFQVVPASTGSSSSTTSTASNDDPTNVKLKVNWTKDELKRATNFAYYKAPTRQTSPTTGMAPRPTPSR